MSLQAATDFLDRLDDMTSEAEINRALRDVLKQWNVEHFCFVRYPQDDQTLDQLTLTQHMPATWLDRYRRRNYLRVDPGSDISMLPIRGARRANLSAIWLLMDWRTR